MTEQDDDWTPTRERRGGLLRNTGITSIAAGAGVLSGLLLDVSIAAAFGAGATTDAFFVAARIPIGITAVFMAGANQALVPGISGWTIRKDRSETSRLTSALFTVTLLGGFVVYALAALVAGPLTAVTAPGLSTASADLAASLTRTMFLLVPLVSAAEVLRAYCNARHRFGAPAAMNVVMNGLAAAIIIAARGHDIHVIAWAYVIGAAAQLVFMLVMAAFAGLRYRPNVHARDPEVRAVASLCVRPLGAAALNPLARVAEQSFVSYLPAGSITILNYAFRLVSAIGGTVFFRSVMIVLLPRLTKASTVDDRPAVARLTRSGILIMFALSLPLTAAMIALSEPAALAVFHRAHFTRDDAAMLGFVLAVYATSLVGQAVQRALLAPFYASYDMVTPWRNSVYGVVANLALLPVLVLPFGHSNPNAIYGVAIAFSLAQYVNVAHGWYRLRSLVPRPFHGLSSSITTLTVASGVAYMSMRILSNMLGLAGHLGRWHQLGLTVGVGAIGAVVFAGSVAVVDRGHSLPILRAEPTAS